MKAPAFVTWIWNNLKPLSELATIVGIVVALGGAFLAYSQLKITNAQLEQANEQRRWQSYNEMNNRYADLYRAIPDEIASGCRVEFITLNPDVRRWVRQYFDLYSEEYWLFLSDLMPKEMWTRRIHGGVRVNLSKYPALVDGYAYWREAGAFRHPDDFHKEVESAIKDAEKMREGQQRVAKCPPLGKQAKRS